MKGWVSLLSTATGVIVLAVACHEQPGKPSIKTNESSVNPILFYFGETNCHVSVVVFDQSKSLEVRHTKKIAKIAMLAEQMKTDFGDKKANEFMAELEDYTPSPFSFKDWSMITSSRMFVPSTNEVWFITARLNSLKKDCALRIESSHSLSGNSFSNITSSVLLQLENAWPHKFMKFSRSKMLDDDGTLISSEVKAWFEHSEFPAQK